ncbi:hypothetical protein L7F22_068754 [Adiantum nelumboides]|nr:hypothetical protein [Adiantum nelumboides]
MAEIHIVETSLVKPVTPTKRHASASNALDLYWSEFGYARTVHFYRIQPGHHDFKAIVQSLKNSLSLLLVHFYPVAGRLVPHTAINSDDNIYSDHDSSLIVLDCNDSGVEFIEACCLDVDFGQLQQQGFRVQDFFARLTRTESRLRPEDPVMSVQVTSFLGGGIAIGCSCDHTIFDGFSFACMIKSWVELCNGELERYGTGEIAYVWDNQAELQQPVVVTEIVDLRTIGFYDAHFGWGQLQAIRPATLHGSGVFSLAPPPPRPVYVGDGNVDTSCKLELIIRLTSKQMGGFLPSLLSAPWPNGK